jgi:hypothetical protein
MIAAGSNRSALERAKTFCEAKAERRLKTARRGLSMKEGYGAATQ